MGLQLDEAAVYVSEEARRRYSLPGYRQEGALKLGMPKLNPQGLFAKTLRSTQLKNRNSGLLGRGFKTRPRHCVMLGRSLHPPHGRLFTYRGRR